MCNICNSYYLLIKCNSFYYIKFNQFIVNHNASYPATNYIIKYK